MRRFLLTISGLAVCGGAFAQLTFGGFSFERTGNWAIDELNRWGVFRGQITQSYGEVLPPTSGSVWTNPNGDKVRNGILFADLGPIDPRARFFGGGADRERTMEIFDWFNDDLGSPVDCVVVAARTNTDQTTNPTEPLTELERQHLYQYIRNGGSFLMAGGNRSISVPTLALQNSLMGMFGFDLDMFTGPNLVNGLWNPNNGFAVGNTVAAANGLVLGANAQSAIVAGPFGSVSTLFCRFPGRVIGINYEGNPDNAARFYQDGTRSTDVNGVGIHSPWPALPTGWHGLFEIPSGNGNETGVAVAAALDGGSMGDGSGPAYVMACMAFDDAEFFNSSSGGNPTYTTEQKRNNVMLMLNTVKWLTDLKTLTVQLADLSADVRDTVVRIDFYTAGLLPPPDQRPGAPAFTLYYHPKAPGLGDTGNIRVILPPFVSPGAYDLALSVVVPATDTEPEKKLPYLQRNLTGVTLPNNAGTGIATFLPGDTNNDNIIDDGDITNVILDFGNAPTGNNGGTDLNGDGMVDDADLTLVIIYYGEQSA